MSAKSANSWTIPTASGGEGFRPSIRVLAHKLPHRDALGVLSLAQLADAASLSKAYLLKVENAVEALANNADVSLEAAGNRLVSLSPAPAAFLVLR